MKKEIFSFEYTTYDSIEELPSESADLIKKATEISKKAYAPYSNFFVGAAILLENGETLVGNNQENASYPVGICAERTLLAYKNANYPDIKILQLAVSTVSLDYPLPPCGMCRQTILEYEKKQKTPIKIFLAGKNGSVIELGTTEDLLPLHFDEKFLD